jgi:ABC-type multidrug transport system fused ATPase/permease subunit
MSPKLALISLGIVPPLFFLLRILGGYMRRLTTKVQDAWAASTQVYRVEVGQVLASLFSIEDYSN